MFTSGPALMWELGTRERRGWQRVTEVVVSFGNRELRVVKLGCLARLLAVESSGGEERGTAWRTAWSVM